MMRNAEAQELARQVVKDQMDWLDAAMKKIVPPVLHDKFVRGDFSQPQMGAWLRRNRIRVIYLSNCPIIRIVKTVHGEDKILDEFKPRIVIEGREVDLWKVMNSDSTDPTDIWADSSPKPDPGLQGTNLPS